MFEKEAEEILNNHCDCELLFECMTGIRCRCSDFEEEKNLLLEGIEFGYSKANEWHKADVPTSPINKVVLGYIKHYNSKLPCLVKWNGEWWYDARTYNDRVKLIAWKEIVLPKEDEIESEMFPEITLPEGSSEFIDKVIADAEKRVKEKNK